MAIDYKDAGVDIEKGDALVDWLKQNPTSKTHSSSNVVSGIGGFSALFRVDFSSMQKPCLVSATDGIGTKIKLATMTQQYSQVGQDLVAMCVNDLICCGAKPLFFLDYYATGKLDLDAAKQFLTGVRNACVESDCELIGGETAEMPGVYHNNDFDAAGFAVGVVDEAKALGAHRVKEGDVLIGIESSGFHSNGFSLVRKVFEAELQARAEEFLTPTNLYVKLSQHLFSECDVHAFCHITGGGIDNLTRVLPKGLSAKINPWPVPKLFTELKQRAEIDWRSLLNTFNCGIGFVIVLPKLDADAAVKTVNSLGYKTFEIGSVIESENPLTVDYNSFIEAT